ncbi:hypothetical protein SAMN05660464_0942 [Geodermatophilus dictyosporus]|uniref:Uncharacterized protein n=1 Tax=Geodermatophilus dictyosporus TaxID=1523247 RepID=A0A1I5JQF6_9ACTN|nr:hypothetical protein SAMN05660464_0942 [Geodermatophilus dictyosporus]
MADSGGREAGGSGGSVRPIPRPPPAAPLTGVCLVRVQWDGDRLRYRVVLTPDVSVQDADVVVECRDLDDALLAVQGFLVGFGAPGVA